ncbi:hypothetical protein HBI56_019650 [Parastagonospora nodorum]|uniref:Uncharacterized protein n=1 Tax=Phaeosphaeria nodorum (strain SN15 / ATCC MYA-4574 / FGSC 10173) TaxID=321614 RepID=A0A7U2I1P4_PHANO|nr:hypothetical protein HBH56_080320 [Parastagonospora nodorum]QRC96496.1 hypothetical protein JI435_014100 [Parastagonospora nodorum SN15]KAH3929908.1 hypothetical protein HBH54_121500 [Parastagonospora nodorum]KAH3955543.1 hypothetical protein HBH53_003120 [Parastagonospora nodorum]KAH3982092.1 hypothetical protein HBH52_076010 [Parastagonospora nodorum]
MPYITYPCWACCSIANEQAKCRICSPRRPKKSRIPKPYNAEKPRRMQTISAPILVSIYNWNECNTEAIQKELDNIREMNTCEPYLGQDSPALTIITPNSENIPSVALHAAENEHPTMDRATFRDVEHEVDYVSDLRVLICPREATKEHKGRKKCKKCYEAKQANAHFASAMRDTEAGLVRNRFEQELASRCGTIMEPEIMRSDFMEPVTKNPKFCVSPVKWWRLQRARRK